MRAAFRADWLREAELRFRAADFAWRDKDDFEAAECPSRFSALEVARDRFAEGFRFEPAFAESRAACFLVFSEAPSFGAPSFTPARRAFDNPIAMACLVDRAPCLPSRI